MAGGRREPGAVPPVEVLGELLQVVSTHVQPLQHGQPNHTVRHAGEVVHGQIQVLQFLQVPQLKMGTQQVSNQRSGPGFDPGAGLCRCSIPAHLVGEVVEVSVHGQLQSLQTLAAAQLLGDELDPVVAQQQLLELRQLP